MLVMCTGTGEASWKCNCPTIYNVVIAYRYDAEVGNANLLAAKERAYEQQRQKLEEENAARKMLAEEVCVDNMGVATALPMWCGYMVVCVCPCSKGLLE